MELRIDGWRQGLRFAAAHVVPGHPKCGKLHGHTYAVHCIIEGRVPESGMIVDFGVLKDTLKEMIAELDHQFIVPADHPELEIIENEAETEIRFGDTRFVVPSRDVAKLPIPTGTVEWIADYLAQTLVKKKVLGENVERVGLGVDEGYGKGAWAWYKL